MATDVKIPALGESISSGILAKWHVQSGDFVEAGQSIFDLETDKITSEATAEISGTITCRVAEGDEVDVGAVVATIEQGEAKTASANEEKANDAKAGDDAKADDSDAQPKADSAATDSDRSDPPSVRRIAAESGINPADVAGTGKGGRVTKADMLDAAANKDAKATDAKASGEAKASAAADKAAAPTAVTSNATAASQSDSTRKKMTPLRRTIAQRLVQAQQTTAMLTTFNEVDMSAVMQFRKQHQEAFTAKHGVKLGFMSFFTKAVVQALKNNPGLNSQIEGDEIVTFHGHHIGIAVSTPKGLMVPVLRDCAGKSFAEIERELLHYAGKARDGKITIADLQGGTFTITNGGIFGSMLSTPILNTPQSAILGMHTIQERPVAVAGQVVIRPMMYLALSYDHRLVDGREAVTFLVDIKKSIEDPSRLLFDI